MSQIVIKMFTRASMFFDEEDVEAFVPVYKGDTIIEPTISPPAGVRYGGTNYWVVEDPRPTKAEAKEKLEGLWQIQVPFRVLKNAPFIKNKPYLLPIFYAPELAELLIEIDPLDRLED
jgi:hypothetical protein